MSPNIKALEHAFETLLETRFRGLPIINEAIEVEAVDFQPWQQDYIGVLITPWLMSLMLLPGDNSDWSRLEPESTVAHEFPAGNREFVINDIENFGLCQMFSLYSPMRQFADQQAAQAAARKVLIDLTDAEMLQDKEASVEELEDILSKVVPPEVEIMEEIAANEMPEAESGTLRERIEKPLSRRDLLRSILPGENES